MKQNIALNILKSGNNVFVTGSAGTGKTYLLEQYTNYLRERRVYPAVVAPTGIAASHLGGQTIHSFFALGIRESIDEEYVGSLMEKKYLKSRFSKLRLLIIDEISMVSPELFGAMDLVLRGFKGLDVAFGGVQVVISGDFFQLPPVSKTPKAKRFAWQSPSWKELDLQTCYLQEKFRQSDSRLIGILDDIRSGSISTASRELLESRYEHELEIDTPTKLYTHNLDVDRINAQELEMLSGTPKLYVCEHKGSEKNIEKIFKSSLVLEKLELKKGAVVIFIKNSPDGEYVNGTTGTVHSFSPIDNMPIVITSTGKKVKLEKEEWSLENDSGKAVASVTQVPLRLAWAITIHKSQGMSLDAAQMDLSKTFEVGQGYVALSRIRSIDGLRLMGLNDMALQVDPLILHIDGRIQAASLKASQAIESIEPNELSQIQKEHIRSLGGVVDEQKIAKERENIKEGKPSHSAYVTSAHTKTKKLIDSSDTLIKLATNRGVSKGTIIQHLQKIREEDPSTDLSKYKPDENKIESILKIAQMLKEQELSENFNEDGTLRLKPIYEALNGEVNYDEIRLCLLFVD